MNDGSNDGKRKSFRIYPKVGGVLALVLNMFSFVRTDISKSDELVTPCQIAISHKS